MKFALAVWVAFCLAVSAYFYWAPIPATPADPFVEIRLIHSRTLRRHKIAALHQFFLKYNCDERFHLEKDYIEAAQKAQIDWRLLPAVSVIESTCGKHYRLNNLWGWNSANTGFGSLREGIRYISGQLGTSRYYKGKTTPEILHSYGPGTSYYVQTVLNLMNQEEDN
jgi:hypothetical protein